MDNFLVGEFEVDTSRCQIRSRTNIYSTEPKVLEVLTILAQHQGDVVSHETLLSKVWPGIVVDPNALQRCISQLRKAFGDDAKKQYAIATFPKKGYSLLLKVNSVRKRRLSRRAVFGLATSVAGVMSIGLLFNMSTLQFPEQAEALQTLENRLRVIPLNINPEKNIYLAYSSDDLRLIYPKQNTDQFSVKNLITGYEQQISITDLAAGSGFAWTSTRADGSKGSE